MLSMSLCFFLVGTSLALPSILPRTTYANTHNTLRKELQDQWYSNWNDPSSKTGKPPNPAEVYSCAGPLMDDYPSKDKWLNFTDMWDINAPIITQKNYGDTYNDDINEAIQDISMQSKVDARLILAMIMQESAGNVGVECTGPTSRDCGLMQLRGSHSFSYSNPKQSITDMITDGVFGTGPNLDAEIPIGTPGYLTLFNGVIGDLGWLGNDNFWRGNPYAAAHLYNAGDISGPQLNVVDGGVERSRYYANDIASRLLGWNGNLEGCWASTQCKGLGFENRVCV